MLDLADFLSYFRFFRDELVPPDFAWWYLVADQKIYDTATLCEEFGYQSKDEISETGHFIEFFRVDIIELKKEFLFKEVRTTSSDWYTLPDDLFDIEFNKFIESNMLISKWFAFEQETLKAVFKNWCSQNHVLPSSNALPNI